MIIAGNLRKKGTIEIPSMFDYYIKNKKSNGKVLICDAKPCDNDFIKMIKEHIDADIFREE